MLDDSGFLPEGVHDLSLEEIEENFGRFNGSDQRCRLFEKLADYFEKLSRFQWFVELIVDGSFVTAKQVPGDIDLVVVVDLKHLSEDNMLPVEYNLLSKGRALRGFGFDVFWAPEDSSALKSYLDFFSQVRGAETRKGIIRLTNPRIRKQPRGVAK